MSDIFIEKETVFKFKNRRFYAMADIYIEPDIAKTSYFILDFWDICEFPDIDITPVILAKCNSKYEAYSLFEDLVKCCFEKADSLLAYIEAENQRVNITFETDLTLRNTDFINEYSAVFESISCTHEDGVLYLRLEVAQC